jgi:post-segregation antitoxin (ccd killing protein)
MKSRVSSAARKRPVNLTLSEDLVEQAKAMTDNLSGVVENLLSEFVQKEQRALLTRAEVIEHTVALWNEFGSKTGSFADEFSTL